MTISVWTVFLAALVTALATGLGALPFILVKEFPRKWLGVFNGIAAGLMLGASFSLLNQGINLNVFRVLAGMLVGLFFISLAHGFLDRDEETSIAGFSGAGSAPPLAAKALVT